MNYAGSGHLIEYDKLHGAGAYLDITKNRMRNYTHGKSYHEHTVSSFDELKKMLAPPSPGLVFRGQKQAEWFLKSKLQRAFDEHPDGIQCALPKSELYKRPLAIAKKRFDLYDLNPSYDGQLWAQLQHYKIPTPLLDWTESPDVALFFAFHGKEDDFPAALFVAAPYTINEWSREFEKPWNGWLFLYPCHFFDPRVHAQSGLFMCQGIEPEPFEKTVETECNESALLKIIIPAELRAEVEEQLALRNVVYEKLFPGPIETFYSLIETDVEEWLKEWKRTGAADEY